MANAILRQEAIDDLNDIWAYTFEKWSEDQGDKYYATIKFTCMQIGENPELGKAYEGISESLLGLKLDKHLIFYQVVTSGEVEVIRILHERIDLKKQAKRIKTATYKHIGKKTGKLALIER